MHRAASRDFPSGWRRACRRHVNTCCGVSPCWRATSETTAPATSVSSTIRALSSSEARRRRPVPVITSSRRTVASGLSVWSSVDTSRSPIQRSSQSPSTDVRRRWGQNSAYDALNHLSKKQNTPNARKDVGWQERPPPGSSECSRPTRHAACGNLPAAQSVGNGMIWSAAARPSMSLLSLAAWSRSGSAERVGCA
jgi:hypothetical protein